MQFLIRIIVPGLAILAAIYIFSRADTSIPARQDGVQVLRIATANLLYMNASSDEATGVLAAQDIDILVLLEWTGRNLDEAFLTNQGYIKAICEPRTGTHGICVFHKAQISVEASIEVAPVGGPCNMPFATIRLDGDLPVGIQAIHPPPPINQCEDTNLTVLNYHAATVREGRLSQAVGVLHPGDAAIVMGDFNALPSWKRVRKFSEAGLVDAFSARTGRLSPTWSPIPWIPDFARIDYIWTSSDLGLLDAWILDVPGSDHRVVVSEILL